MRQNTSECVGMRQNASKRFGGASECVRPRRRETHNINNRAAQSLELGAQSLEPKAQSPDPRAQSSERRAVI